MAHALALALLTLPARCRGLAANSGNNIGRIRSAILDRSAASSPARVKIEYDATTVPLEEILSTLPRNDDAEPTKVYCASDFAPQQELSASAYTQFTRNQHQDCMNLFDRYETNLIRCEALDDTSVNVRWEAAWVPGGSTWLYDLSGWMGWKITRKRPDPAKVATFSWKAVFGLFQQAFATGNVTLPISIVEGNTVVSIAEESLGGSRDWLVNSISLKESIDLVAEADKNRLQNRRVAQEVASWIDVSRRPLEEFGIDAEEWAGRVRQRILHGVPGAGALDVDPNEDESEGGIALLLFGIICVGAVGASFEFFLAPEIIGT